MELSCKQLRSRGRELLKTRTGFFIGLMVAVALLSAVAGWTFVGVLAVGAIALGDASAMIKAKRAKVGDYTLLFKAFDRFGSALLLSLLISIYTFLWSLLFVIPGIVAAYKYSQAYYILADHPEYTASQALAESCRLMNGYKAKLFLLQLSFFGWMLLVTITLGIAGFWVIPYINCTNVEFYHYLLEKDGQTIKTANDNNNNSDNNNNRDNNNNSGSAEDEPSKTKIEF